MKDFEVNNDTKVVLYIKGCYGCDRDNKYGPIHQFVIDKRIPLGNFSVRRIELDPDWQEFVKKLDIELPIVLFENADGNQLAINYDEFVKTIQDAKDESAKPQAEQSAAGAELEESPVAPSKKRKKPKNAGKANES